jgi:hypothetical protein
MFSILLSDLCTRMTQPTETNSELERLAIATLSRAWQFAQAIEETEEKDQALANVALIYAALGQIEL